MMIMDGIFSLLLSAALPLMIVGLPSEGDVSLIGIATGYKNSSYIGRLEIYMDGKWGTFCRISDGGAQAACRQMQYEFGNYSSYNDLDERKRDLVPPVDQDTPINIATTYCPFNLNDDPLLHVLRCGYSTNVSSNCTHGDDIVLECYSHHGDLYTKNYYEFGVYLFTRQQYYSQGVLAILYGKHWKCVCRSDSFNMGAADTACRQLGYTNALSFDSYNLASSHEGYNIQVASNKSFSCMNCIISNVHLEKACSEFVNLTCTYNPEIAANRSAGSKLICQDEREGVCPHNNSNSADSHSKTVIICVTIGCCFIIFILPLIIVVSCTFYYCRRRQHGYQTLG